MSGRRRSGGSGRRRPRLGWPWLVGAALVVVVGLAVFFPINRSQAPETTPTPLPSVYSYPNPQELQRAEIVEVIDGDTIDVRLDGQETRVRYYGIDTPERGEHCFDEARSRNQQLADDEVLLLPDARDTDSHGRLLRYVFTSDGLSIDASLVAEGYAYAWREDGTFREQLIALEEQAQAQAIGCLWQEE
jgi:micrococcal nuclease